MLYILILIGFLGGSAVLLWRLGKLATEKGEQPRTWQLYALIAWGFMWVGERIATGALISIFPSLTTLRWIFVVMMLAGCWGIYMLLRDRLKRRSDTGDWQERMEEIGEE